MKSNSKALLAAGLLALAGQASAQVATVCPATNVCYKLNIPSNTASSGNGDIFFQISAPSSYEWVALGQGTRMNRANMFVVYTSSGGSNVTLSTRSTTGNNPPTYNSNAQVTLLEGSGVKDGIMTANVRCSNCNSWSGGTMDFKASNGNWIYAYNPSGGPLNSNDNNADINQHSGHDSFRWDFSNAKGGDSVNPLISTTSGNNNNNGPGNNNNNNNSPGNNGNSGNSGIVSVSTGSPIRPMIIAHGVLASLAFVILFPMGAIAIRLASFPGIVWIHAAFQVFAYVVFIAAFGLGVWLATQNDLLNNHHPIIGIVVFVLLFLQPIGGFMHHIMFKKTGGRTIWSQGHIWLGRLTITLGIINGGLGMQLAHRFQFSSKPGMIVYGVVAGLVWLAWVGASVVGERKRANAAATHKVSRQASNETPTEK